MAELEIGRFIRVKAAIEGTLRVESSVMAADALSDAQQRYRANIVALLPDDLKEEFEVLFPAVPSRASSGGRFGEDLLGAASIADAARERLLGMAGWLDGLVQSHKG